MVRAAKLTKADASLLWVIVGEGEERLLIENAGRNLPNLRLLPLQPAATLCQMYAAADVLLLNQKTAVKDAVIPSKLLTYMAAGKPVLCAAPKRVKRRALFGKRNAAKSLNRRTRTLSRKAYVPCASTPHSASRWEQAGGPTP